MPARRHCGYPALYCTVAWRGDLKSAGDSTSKRCVKRIEARSNTGRCPEPSFSPVAEIRPCTAKELLTQ